MSQIVSRGHTRPLTEISYVEDGPDRTLLVSSAHDKLPQIRNGETGDWIGSFQGHKGAVWSAKVDKLTRTLAVTASGDFSAKMWCVHTGKELCEFKHKHVVKTVDFAADSLHFATGCQDGLIRIYNTCQPAQSPQEYKASFNGMADCITKVIWNSETSLIVGKRSGSIELWDTRSSGAGGAAVARVLPAAQVVMDMELHTNRGIMLVACGSQVLTLSLEDLRVLRAYDMPATMSFKEEGGASLSPDGSRFIAGGSDLWLREVDVQSGAVLRTFKGHHGPIRCVRYHSSGLMGASGSEDGTIRIWDLAASTSGNGNT